MKIPARYRPIFQTPLRVTLDGSFSIDSVFCIVKEMGRIRVSFSPSTVVEVRERFLWHTVYSPKALYRRATGVSPNWLTFYFTSGTTFRLRAGKSAWEIVPSLHAHKLPERKGRVPQWRRGLSLSFGFHGLLFLLSVICVSYLGTAHRMRSQWQTSHAFNQPLAVSANSSRSERVPFSGISYDRFLARWISQNGTTSEKLDHFLNHLGSPSRLRAPSHLRTSFDPNDRSSVYQSDRLVQALEGDTSARGSVEQLDPFPEDSPNTESFSKTEKSRQPLSSADKSMVQNVFLKARESLKSVYGEALAIDPKLSVTVQFQVRIGENGDLRLQDIRARGRYTEIGLLTLKQGMARVLSAMSLPERLRGVTVRGESAFVR